MTDVTLRNATATDAGAIKRVARAAWHAAYDDVLGPDAVDETVDAWYDPDRLVADDVRDPDRPFVLAARDGDVVGFAEAAARDRPSEGANDEPSDESGGSVDGAPVWHLYRPYVHPTAWGEGVGTALLDRIEDALRRRGVDELRVFVLAANDVCVGFYESRGFDRVATGTEEQFDAARHEYGNRL
jgi:GNAT superfamily N-acetyltransferase